jgi:hypothetical protein
MIDENEGPVETRVHEARQKVQEIKRRRQRSSTLTRIFVLVVLVGGGILAYLLLQESFEPIEEIEVEEEIVFEPERVVPPAPVSPPREIVAESAPPPSPPEPKPIDLPLLTESDPLVRELATDLTTRAELDEWLLANDLLWRFTISVMNVAEGTSPRHQLAAMAPRKPFKARVEEGRITVDPSSYARYDVIADVFTSLHTRASVRLFQRLRPLLDQAYADLGFPDASLDDTLRRALSELLLTPQIDGEPYLSLGIVSYEFEDPRLEALSPAQKQLLRTGPDNVSRIQAKIRDFASELGIPESDLPATITYQSTP